MSHGLRDKAGASTTPRINVGICIAIDAIETIVIARRSIAEIGVIRQGL